MAAAIHTLCAVCATRHEQLQRNISSLNGLPILLNKRNIPASPEPQHLIAHSLQVNAVVAQGRLVLLEVVDVTGGREQTHEDGNGILGQLLARELRQLAIIQGICRGGYLDSRASRAALVVGDLHAVDIGFCDAGECANRFGYLGG